MNEDWKRLIWSFGFLTAVTRGATAATEKLTAAWQDYAEDAPDLPEGTE